MEVTVRKITDEDLMRRCCGATINKPSSMTLEKIYKCMHSPARSQMFELTMTGVPVFVSTHILRHCIGNTHYIRTYRDDRGGSQDETRYTPTNHIVLTNAESFVNMARKRLCYQAHIETVHTMQAIKDAVALVDPALAKYMQPECHYRNGYCPELRPCGFYKVQTTLTFPEMTKKHPDYPGEYTVVCDETNNIPEDIAHNLLNVDFFTTPNSTRASLP